MKTLVAFLVSAVLLTWSGVAAALDTIRLEEGQVVGRIIEISATKVRVERGSSGIQEVDAHRIETILYEGEPSVLKTAKLAVLAGRYEDALESLTRLELPANEKAEIKQDVQFYTAYCKARLALASNDQQAITEAGQLLVAFISQNANSYHFFPACRLVGDMLVALGKYAPAQEYYQQLTKAPWPEYQMLANVAVGNVLLAQNKVAEAQQRFEQALQISAAGPAADQQRLAATLGKARCLASAGQSDQAVGLIQEVIAKADPEDKQLHAMAYNALGLAYRKADKPKEALLAYLHTHVLYFSSPAEHIEALRNLVELFTELRQQERANQMAKVLQERYNRSP